MEIKKYKKIGKSKYKVFFDKTQMIIYEDIILKYNLLSKNNIDLKMLDIINEENKYYEAYEKAVNYLNIKLRSKKELEKYLNKFDYSNCIIKQIIANLLEEGYLNDENYINAFIHDKVNLTSEGPLKIKKDLLSYDFDENIINKYLNEIEQGVWKNKINKIIHKKNNNTSNYLYKTKLQKELFYKGYEKELVDNILQSLVCDEEKNLKIEIEKVKKRYKSKYKGKELKEKIITFLISKGYSYESVNKIYENNNL